MKKQIQIAIKGTKTKSFSKKIHHPVNNNVPLQDNENIILKQDVLKRHAVALPKNADINKLQPLIKKLHTALIETHGTIAIGSNNKILNCQKMCSTQRNGVGEAREEPVKLYLSPFKQSASIQKSLLPYTFIEEKENAIAAFVHFVIQAEKMRIGNCTELAVVAASYLWRFPGKEIKSIELVKSIDFDHIWLILNRKKESDLLNSAEWGEDCWIFDPWWGEEGTFYHAEHFQEKIIEVLSYLITQYEWLKKNDTGYVPLQESKKILNQYKKDFKENHFTPEIKLKNKICIDIDTMPYPFESSMRMSDYYEVVSANKKQAHQQKFQPCLDEIKKMKKPTP